MIFLKMHVAKTIKNIAMYDPFTSHFIQKLHLSEADFCWWNRRFNRRSAAIRRPIRMRPVWFGTLKNLGPQIMPH